MPYKVYACPVQTGPTAGKTVKPEEFYRRIPTMVLDEGVEVEEISSPDDNLQAVFDYLVK